MARHEKDLFIALLLTHAFSAALEPRVNNLNATASIPATNTTTPPTAIQKIYPVGVSVVGRGSIYALRPGKRGVPATIQTPPASPRGDRGRGSDIISGWASGLPAGLLCCHKSLNTLHEQMHIPSWLCRISQQICREYTGK